MALCILFQAKRAFTLGEPPLVTYSDEGAEKGSKLLRGLGIPKGAGSQCQGWNIVLSISINSKQDYNIQFL